MALDRKTCTLIVDEFPDLGDYLFISNTISVFFENWNLKIHLKSEKTNSEFKGSAKTQFYFRFSDDLPLKVLMKLIYYYLTFYRTHRVKSLKDTCVGELVQSDAISEINYNISKDESPLHFSSVEKFKYWISLKVQKGMRKG